MLDNFYSILAALGPVFLLVMIGHIMGRLQFPAKDFWPQAERFTYYFLFPVLLILKIGSASLPAGDLSQVIFALMLLLVFSSIMVLLLAWLIESDTAKITSIFQGGIRFNTYVGLAAAAALYGEQGIVWGAVFMAVMIPTINIACIICFALLVPENNISLLKNLWLGVVKNPLILGCITGGILNVSGVGIPGQITPLLTLISGMALPLGLLAVGVGLNFDMLKRGGLPLWLSTAFKLFMFPLIFLAIALYLDLPTDATAVILLFTMLPTAPSAYILSRQLKGDASLMAAIITFQTLFAMVSMPLMLVLLA